MTGGRGSKPGRKVVVDTNVGVCANGQATAAEACQIECIAALREVTRRGHVVLDDADRILSEYRRRLRLAGRPGAGDIFMKWVHDNQANPARCTLVRITPSAGGGADDFDEFPLSPALASFDRNDRKFVAVALAHGKGPEILEATDTDWWVVRKALAAAGVTVTFLCPEEMTSRTSEDA